MTTLEPQAKKLKTNHDSIKVSEIIDDSVAQMKASQQNLQPVLGDEFEKPIPLIKVYAGNVKRPQDLSKCVSVLNEKIPLKELQHLKRVRKNIVLLCPSHFLNGMSSIQEFIECNVSELKNIFEYFKEIDVPYYAPKTKKQFKEANKYWSCNFHPNLSIEKLVGGNFFSNHELVTHQNFMEIAFEVAKYSIQNTGSCVRLHDCLENLNAAVVVDPAIQSIVAVAFDNKESHPLQHAAMLAIDNVAKTQGGGVWLDEEKYKYIATEERGVDPELLMYLKTKYHQCSFSANKFRSFRDMTEEERNCTSDDRPYLCTGYYIYLLREPCLMCSMALVHARVKRIFFCFDDSAQGALRTRLRLQTIQSLNHHFEVFTGFL